MSKFKRRTDLLTGAKGDQGPEGPSGKQGFPGTRGAPGADGPKGAQGPRGLPGKDGVDGKDGTDGAQGKQGLTGTRGAPGADGADGKAGPAGPKGDQGERGDAGLDGKQGFAGTRGIPGQDGVDGTNGLHGTDGQDGEKGDTGEDGPQGKAGAKGDQGDKGEQGDTGPQGEQGEEGERGPRGWPGGGGGGGFVSGSGDEASILPEEMLPVGDIAIPGTFNNTLNSEIYWDGDRVQYVKDPYDAIDWTLTEGLPNDYYVNYVEGDNANAGTSSGAGNSWKTLDYGIANASSPAIIHLEDDNIGYLSSAATPKQFTGKLKLIGEGVGGRTRILAMREGYTRAGFSWTATGSSNAYKSSTAQAKQYRSQFYLGNIDEEGFPEPMPVAVDATDCEETPGTFFWTGTELYVHMPDGTEPDPLVNWLYSESPYDFEIQQGGATSSDVILIENLEFLNNNGTATAGAGMRYRPVTTGAETSARVGVKNCLVYGGCTNALQVYDADVVVVHSCGAKYNHRDGFNYHSFVSTGSKGEYITVYEHNCTSQFSGYDRWQDQFAQSSSNNGSTAHDSMHIIRTNAVHGHANGAVVADVNGAHSLNYFVRAEAPTGTATPKACFWHDKYLAAGTTQIMYLWGCSGNDMGDPSVHLLDNSAQVGPPTGDGEIRVQYWTERVEGTVVGTVYDFDGNATYLGTSVARLAGDVLGPLASPNDATVLFDGISGTRLKPLKNNFSALTAPALTDDENSGYGVGSTWIDVEAGAHYTLMDPSAGAAVWAAAAGDSHAHVPQSATLTRDGNGAVETVTVEGENTWTISRNPDTSVASLTDTVYLVTVDRDGGGIITGVTATTV